MTRDFFIRAGAAIGLSFTAILTSGAAFAQSANANARTIPVTIINNSNQSITVASITPQFKKIIGPGQNIIQLPKANVPFYFLGMGNNTGDCGFSSEGNIWRNTYNRGTACKVLYTPYRLVYSKKK